MRHESGHDDNNSLHDNNKWPANGPSPPLEGLTQIISILRATLEASRLSSERLAVKWIGRGICRVKWRLQFALFSSERLPGLSRRTDPPPEGSRRPQAPLGPKRVSAGRPARAGQLSSCAH